MKPISMKSLSIAFILACLLLSVSGPRPVRAFTQCYVNGRVTGGANDGTTWLNAYNDLHLALTGSCGVVWVAADTYTPGTTRSATFQLMNGVAIYGGFAGGEANLSERDWVANVTTLTGGIGGGSNVYHVVNGSGTNSSARLDGFTIGGGKADGSSPDDKGAGVYNSSGSPSLANLIIVSNSAVIGGGMYNYASSPDLDNVTFTTNSASTGAGMANYTSSAPTLDNVDFSANTTTASDGLGGGMYNDHSSPVLNIVTFSDNTALNGNARGGAMFNNVSPADLDHVSMNNNSASQGGGGIYNAYSSPTLTNCTLTSNSATNYGGGMYNESSSPDLDSVDFSLNSAGSGGGMYNIDSSSPTLTRVFFSRNTATDGAGIFNSASNPGLSIVTFDQNAASGDGGGMFNISSAAPALDSSIFRYNTANNGAGLFNDDSSPTLTDVIFSSNSANNAGGGIFNASSSPVLAKISFSYNSAAYGGGMYDISSSIPSLTNVTFFANSALSGAGMLNNSTSNAALNNVTLSGNSASVTGGGLYNDGSSPVIQNSIIWGNSAPSDPQVHGQNFAAPTITYSDVQGGCPVNATCTSLLNADPVLGSLGDYGGTSASLPLLPGSAAIDAGDPGSTCAATDQRGVTRTLCDIGAFESQAFTLAIASGDNQTGYINSTFAQPLAISVSSAAGDPVDGGLVTFTPPASGAGASFATNPVTISSGLANGIAVANDILGSYSVTAGLPGSLDLFSFHLTNLTPPKPGVPGLLHPKNGALVTGFQPRLDWKDVLGVQRYQLQVSKSSSFKGRVVDESDITSSEFTPATSLAANTTWYWRVRAYNGLGQVSAWSSVRSFRTRLAAPLAISPVGGVNAGTLKPTFKWSKVNGASGYTIQVSANSSFSPNLFSKTISAVTSYKATANLPAGADLYWRVRANGTNGPGDWMTYAKFRTP